VSVLGVGCVCVCVSKQADMGGLVCGGKACVAACVAVCCSVLQCVAACCSMLQHVAACCSDKKSAHDGQQCVQDYTAM